MSKQVIRYRTCDKCADKNREVEAAVTDKVMFNGSRFDLDLCETHSLELFSALMAWLDLGTKTGESGIFDQQKKARPITVAVDPVVPAPPLIEPEPEAAPATPVVPIRTVIADDPELPLTASRWVLSRHAEQRREQRQLSLAEVLWAAERPEWTKPSSQGRGAEERHRGNCTVVVDPHDNTVITVIDEDEDSREAFIDDFLNRNRKVQG